MNDDWQVISCYTRKQAIEDGVLIDVTEQAKQLGFKVNTCVAGHLYFNHLVPSADLEGDQLGPEGRLTDLLLKTLIAASEHGGQDRVSFDVLFQTKQMTWEPIRVLAIMGPGDDYEPVLTIMLPEDE